MCKCTSFARFKHLLSQRLELKSCLVVYRDNLFNTNAAFDWGVFRAFEQELAMGRSANSFFSVSFSEPGVYVLKLSSNQHKRVVLSFFFFKPTITSIQNITLLSIRCWQELLVLLQYVRVLPAGGDCYDIGPFFATDPHHMIRMGITPQRQLLLRPDWWVIGGLLAGATVVLCLCLAVLVSLV